MPLSTLHLGSLLGRSSRIKVDGFGVFEEKIFTSATHVRESEDGAERNSFVYETLRLFNCGLRLARNLAHSAELAKKRTYSRATPERKCAD